MVDFGTDGYLVVQPLFEESDWKEIQRVLRASASEQPCLWDKDLAAVDANVLRVATHPAIVERLAPLLGDDIVLWGASLLKRDPGQVHPWHTDVESSRPEGGFVAVWIGVEGTTQSTSLKFVPGSHRFGTPLQQVSQARGVGRESSSDDAVRAWAGELSPEPCDVVQPALSDGDALFFDGRLWHGSANGTADTTRHCLLLQYAAGDAPVRMRDFSQRSSIPFRFLERPKPPCIAVRGAPDRELNSFVNRPPVLDATVQRMASGIFTMDVESPVPPGETRRQEHFLDGHSGNLNRMRSHYSVLAAGESPHPPHSHVEEELLIVVHGEATLRYADEAGKIVDHPLVAGEGVYYPAFHRHTIYNHSDAAVAYLMFKWIASRTGVKEPTPLQRFAVRPIEQAELSGPGYSKRVCFRGTTHHLKKLQAHVSTLLPGGGYDAHVDEHDVALLVLEGRVKTLDRVVSAGEFAWYAAGEPHGIENPDDAPARYIVFEFHGEGCAGEYSSYRPPRALFKKRGWSRLVRNLRRIVTLPR